MQRLHEAAEIAKAELSLGFSSKISLPFITADQTGPKHLEASLSRAKFSALVEPHLEGVLRSDVLPLAEVLREENLSGRYVGAKKAKGQS